MCHNPPFKAYNGWKHHVRWKWAQAMKISQKLPSDLDLEKKINYFYTFVLKQRNVLTIF